MTYPDVADNELDIRGLCCRLWRGKWRIIAGGAVFALLAWIASMLMTPKWSATAITERPALNMLSDFYSQQQFLIRLDGNSANPFATLPDVANDAYQEFLLQLAAWDTRRDFWLQSDWYQQHKKGQAGTDAVLLDKLIATIQFQPADNAKKLNDTIRLVAPTARDANRLLRQYIAFTNARAVKQLNAQLSGDWAAHRAQLQAQIRRQAAVSGALYSRQVNRIEQALNIARKQGLEQAKTSASADQLPDSQLFLLGSALLQEQLAMLRATGPSYGQAYEQDRAMLETLNAGPERVTSFETWRYLRTPEEPVSRDSPRRLLMMVMWGVVGMLVGAGSALLRRRTPV